MSPGRPPRLFTNSTGSRATAAFSRGNRFFTGVSAHRRPDPEIRPGRGRWRGVRVILTSNLTFAGAPREDFVYSSSVTPTRPPAPEGHTALLWPCPQCDSVNVKVLGPQEELWPYLWAQCEDCREVWPAQEVPTA